MPPRTALATSLRGWRCPQCTQRAFSTSQSSRAVGPEHPKYIEVPEAPQQTATYLPPVKGSLPVPRNVLAGTRGKDKASDEWLDQVTKRPKKDIKHPRGSREEYEAQISESRRRNLREGVKDLKSRQQYVKRKEYAQSKAHNEERWAAVTAPEREDERLTTPSHGLDLQQLLKGNPIDPNREDRLAHKRANLARHNQIKQNARLNELHELYVNAKHFIVTPEQLDEAVEDAFGADGAPRTFGSGSQSGGGDQSIWGEGKPMSVQDMLANASGASGRAINLKGGLEASKQRVREIAEELTGGKMEES